MNASAEIICIPENGHERVIEFSSASDPVWTFNDMEKPRGLNQAIYDIAVLADRIKASFDTDTMTKLETYSSTGLRRVWQAPYFGSRQTNMLQRHE